jgi:hypothetical protein
VHKKFTLSSYDDDESFLAAPAEDKKATRVENPDMRLQVKINNQHNIYL